MVLEAVDGPVVIFIDEIDAVKSLPFSSDEFFAAIRACRDQRVEDAEFGHLSFCLLGVATPSDLIIDPQTTPFNVGQRIELSDFAEADIEPLVAGLEHAGDRARDLARRVLYWTNGHPYLSQRLCSALLADASTQAEDVDRLCRELFLSERARDQDPNLAFVRDHIVAGSRAGGIDIGGVLTHYDRVLRGKRVEADDTNPALGLMKTAGITTVTDGALRPRNRIYEDVFDRDWVRDNMPDAELRRQAAAFRRGFARAAAAAAVVLAVIAGLGIMAAGQSRRARHAEIETSNQLAEARSAHGQHLLKTGDGAGLLYLLDAAQRAPDGSEARASRSLEWAIWQHRLTRHLRYSIALPNPITTWASSEDGDSLLVGTAEGDVQVWDAETGVAAGPKLTFSGRVVQLVWSPDATRYAASTADGFVHVRPHRESGALSLDLYQESDSAITMRFTPDGRALITGSYGGLLRRWDTERGELDRPPFRYRAVPNWSPQIRRDAEVFTCLESAAPTATQVWYSTDAGTEIGRTTGRSASWYGVVEPSSFRQVVGYQDGSVHVLGIGGESDQSIHSHRADAWAAQFSPDGAWLAVAGKSPKGVVSVLDAHTGASMTPPIPYEGSALYSSRGLAFSHDRRHLAVAAGDRVTVWDTATGTEAAEPYIRSAFMPNANSPRQHIVFHPARNTRFLTLGQEGVVQSWDLEEAKRHRTVLAKTGEPAVHVAIRQDDNVIAATVGPTTIELRHATPPYERYAVARSEGTVGRLAFAWKGSALAAASSTGVEVWDTATPDLRHELIKVRPAPTHVEFTRDGELLVALARDEASQALHLWNAQTREQVGDPITLSLATAEGDVPRASALSLHPTGREAAVGYDDGGVRILDIPSGRLRRDTLSLPRGVTALAHAPTGGALAVATLEAVYVWEGGSGEAPRLLAQSGRRTTLVFSPDGRLLVAGSWGSGADQMWEVATGHPLNHLMEQSHGVTGAAFSRDGRWLLVGGGSVPSLRVWSMPNTTRSLREMQTTTWATVGARLDDRGAVQSISTAERQGLVDGMRRR